MIEQLFGSKTRAKLLQLFLSNPNRSFYVREITRKIDEQINSVRRELANLLSIGIITSDTTDNRLYYEVNQDYQYYEPLAQIFGNKKPAPAKKSSSSKTKKAADVPAPEVEVAADHPLVVDLAKYGQIDIVVLSGQFTRDDSAGADVLVVGSMPNASFENVMSTFEQNEGKELRYALFSLDDFRYRRQINDRFISDFLLAKKQVLTDKTNSL